MSLRVAVIGCGSRGARRARALRELGIDEIFVTDQDPEKARRLAVEVRGTAIDSAVAAAAAAEAVLLCTPAPGHVGLALDVVRGGAHVFIEPPVSDSLAGTSVLVEAVASSGRVAMVGSRLRFHPGLERLRTLLQAGTLGRVYGVSVWFGLGVNGWPPLRGLGEIAAPAASAGTTLAGVEWLDALRWLFGQPVEVTALCADAYPGSGEGEDVRAAIVRFEGGAVVQVYADGLRGPETSRLEVLGTEGALRWSAGGHRIILDRRGGGDRRVEEVRANAAELDTAELRHFLACVLTGRTPITDAVEGRETLALALAVQRSSRLRRALAVGEQGKRAASRRGFPAGLRLVHGGEL